LIQRNRRAGIHFRVPIVPVIKIELLCLLTSYVWLGGGEEELTWRRMYCTLCTSYGWELSCRWLSRAHIYPTLCLCCNTFV